MRNFIAGAVCAVIALTGCEYRTSEEDQRNFMVDSQQEAADILGLGPFHESHVGWSDTGEHRPRRLNSAYWYQEKALEHVIHGNACSDWEPSWIPLTGKDEQWAFHWIDKRNDEMAKPAAKQNLREAMQYDDGRTVYVCCQKYR